MPACGLEIDEGEDSEGEDGTSSDRFLRGGDAADGGEHLVWVIHGFVYDRQGQHLAHTFGYSHIAGRNFS